MIEWITMRHPDAGECRVPDQPGVREAYEARGWVETDAPDAPPFVPPKVVEVNAEDGWVDLYHPLTHAVHRFPSHPDAVQGAYEAGWQASPPKRPEPAPVDPEQPAPVEDKATAKKAASKTDTATPGPDKGE